MGVVAFGILHLIGVSIILAYPFLRLRFTNLVLGSLIFVAGRTCWPRASLRRASGCLPFGVVPEDVIMPDYRPLLALVRRRPDRAVLRERGLRRVAEGPRSSRTRRRCWRDRFLPPGQKLAVYLPDPPAHHHRLARRNGRRRPEHSCRAAGRLVSFSRQTVTVSGVVPERIEEVAWRRSHSQ